LAAGAALFATAGGLTAYAVGATAQPTPSRTVTVNVGTGERGPAGPPGPPGPAGSVECPTGYTYGALVINHPGGQTQIATCIRD
jgi:hypothetical protein